LQGEQRKALDLPTPIYGWFTEGFDAADFEEADAFGVGGLLPDWRNIVGNLKTDRIEDESRPASAFSNPPSAEEQQTVDGARSSLFGSNLCCGCCDLLEIVQYSWIINHRFGNLNGVISHRSRGDARRS